MLTSQDSSLLSSKNISEETLNTQVQRFKDGFPFLHITAPATAQNGIKTFDAKAEHAIELYYDKHSSKKTILKFVPASGAASRMFKMLFKTLEQLQAGDRSALNKEGFYSAQNFADNLQSFAFFENLKMVLAENKLDIETLIQNEDYATIIDYILSEKGLNYGKLPKGLLDFHNYSSTVRTPLEEHLVEAALYATNSKREAHIHFTISPEHKENFVKRLSRVQATYEAKFKVSYKITFSEQKASTDTIAVNLDNTYFRDENDNLLFRPAGHGALIENLNEIEADLVFIKNIDNVVPDRLKEDTIKYKKIIGGVLLKQQEAIFKYLDKLNKSESIDEKLLADIKVFLSEELSCSLPSTFDNLSPEIKKETIVSLLDRPIRVCGMVRNEGEPGGGPFIVQHANGISDLQIVEKAQIDENDSAMNEILAKSTHFNPVDLVCSTKRYVGDNFNLKDFVDADAGIITNKTMNGKELKALELPGLWNGAMAKWNTIFVEVPLSTFNPVKEVNDLLRPQHQQQLETAPTPS